MSPGDAVVTHAGTKHRVAVVLEVREPAAFVAWVTGTHRPDHPHVEVEHGSQAGRSLHLDKPSYFYRTNMGWRPMRDLRRAGGRGTPDLRQRLRALLAVPPVTACGSCDRASSSR